METREGISKNTILVVDDEEELLTSLQRPLQTKYRVLTTTRSTEVMNILCFEKTDVILLDIRMPGMTGIELLKEIKFMYPHIPVLIMTGHGDENDTITTLKYGASGYIKKPIDLYFLFNEIERVLSGGDTIISNEAPPKILLIDDEPEFLKSITRALSSHPYVLDTATAVEEAIEKLESDKFDIVMVDIKLHGINGLEFIENLEKKYDDIVTIVITGNSSQELAINAIKHGVFDYIRKPVDIKDLVSAIERSIHKLRVNREIFHKNKELIAKESILQKLNDEIIMQKNYLENVVKSISNMLMVTDENGYIKTINDASIKTLGYSADDIIGSLFGKITTIANFEKFLNKLTHSHNISNIETEYTKKDGQNIFVLLSASVIRKATGAIEGFVFIAQDISSQKEAEQELYRLSFSDSLTSLPNRLRFEMLTKEALISAAKNRLFLAFLYIDLDGFKAVNDRLGHAVGDGLLKEVAKRLQNAFRNNDFVARLGGDEFAILLYRIKDKADAGMVAQRIISFINRPFYIDNNEISVGASVGISIYPESAMDFEQLFKNADIALYKAKHAGRNQYQYFTQQLDSEYAKQLGIENALRFALGRDEFYMVYQPVYDLHSNKIVALEALLRWENSEFGHVSPQDFVPIAEYIGLIIPIGEWIIDTAIKQFAYWKKKYNLNVKLHLNISACQLDRGNYIIELLQSNCQKYKVAPSDIAIELTETAIMHNPLQAEKVLAELSNFGFIIVVDDFGQGYSSLSLLSRLPVAVLKIDKQFINELNDAKNETIVKTIITLSKSLAISVVAEGIETKEQLNYLLSIGCDKGQGFYLCKPQTTKKLLPFLTEEKAIED
jgi:diguanylate cyclase (GGDEF)-like protein/PAS domain S-box-containing protein